MRLVAGETLAARLATRRETAEPETSKGAAEAPADLPAAVHLIEQVARALEAAHAAGVTHRAPTLSYRALAILRLRRIEDAIEDCAELTRLAPDDPAAHLLLAQARIDAQRWKPAADALRRVLELDPGHVQARGLLDATLKRIDE